MVFCCNFLTHPRSTLSILAFGFSETEEARQDDEQRGRNESVVHH